MDRVAFVWLCKHQLFSSLPLVLSQILQVVAKINKGKVCLWTRPQKAEGTYAWRDGQSPSPVFDRLQYADMEGEGLGDLITCGDVQ